MMEPNPSRRWWWISVVSLAAVLPRLPVAFKDFGVEDFTFIQHAAEHSGFSIILLEAWPYGFYRPVVTLHFDLLYGVFGEWAPGYHLASIALHLLVTWLVFLLVGRTTERSDVAWPAALIFAVLPSHTEAIAWASSVGDLLATALVITSVLLAVAAPGQPARRAGWIWFAALLTAVLACGAKESAVAVGLVAPLAGWFFAERRPRWGWSASFFVLVAGYVLWYGSRTPRLGNAGWLLGWPWEWGQRFFQDVGMILIPVARGTIGDRIWSDSTLTWVGTLGGMVLAFWLVFRALRAGDRTMLFGWIWAAVFFFPTWRLPWAERYSYLPSVGVVLVAAALFARVPDRYRGAAEVGFFVLAGLLAIASGVAASNWGWD